MRHLYNSRAELLRLTGHMTNGTPVLAWGKVPTVVDAQLGVAGELMCRLDLNFVRPGKDQPMPIVAGRAPDRVGVLFFDAVGNAHTVDTVKAGDRVHCLDGPVTGTFEIRVIPDPAVDFATVHHMEVQVIEVSQALRGVFPGAVPED